MEDRLEIWLELLAGKLDRLIELGENVERASRSQEMPEEWGEHEGDHFAGANKMVSEGPDNLRISMARELEGYRLVNDSDIGKIVEVQNSTADPWRECTLLAIDWDRPYGFLCRHSDPVIELRWCFARIKIDEPAKEPEHPAGPMPDPGEGCCEPTEKGIGGDIEVIATASWINGRRSPAEAPAKEPVPAWEPKVGDWVLVTRPQNWQECRNPDWSTVMHQYDDNVMQVSCYEKRWGSWVANFYGIDWFFHRDWLSPAEPPAIDKPPEPEYREPVLPADCGKGCEFSDDSISWEEGDLIGWRANLNTFNWESDHDSYRYARIRKNA